MPLIEHIYELRTRLLIAVAAIVVMLGVGFWWYGSNIFVVPSLGQILTDPYCDIPPGARLQLGDGDECRLLATGPFEQFMLRLKVSATAGIVLASPIWLYQLWAFITPGLHKNERRYGFVFTILAAILFIGGAVLAWRMPVYGGLTEAAFHDAYIVGALLTGIAAVTSLVRYRSEIAGSPPASP